MDSKKILTVSYGTFSCTLEGFDDSFETMKAIAEYFRDLAVDDRYFGAEPPHLDADTLARIAGPGASPRHAGLRGSMNRNPQDTAPAASADAARRSGAETEAPRAAAATAPRRRAPAALIGDRATAESASAFFAQSPTASRPAPGLTDAFDGAEAPQATAADGDTIAAKLARIRAVVARNDLPEYNDEDVAVDRSPWRYGALGSNPAHPEQGGPADARGETHAPTVPEVAVQGDNVTGRAEETEETITATDEDDLHDILDRIAAAGAGNAGKASQAAEAAGESAERPAENPGAAARDDLTAPDGPGDVSREDAHNRDGARAPGKMEPLKLGPADRAIVGTGDIEAQTISTGAARAPDTAAPRKSLCDTDPEAAGDVSRLMEEADEQMAEPEAATRRSAFAHLRAAVAARFADRSISQDQVAKAAENAQTFKSDLADAVDKQGAAAAPEAETSSASARSRPAPLKLAAAQRVDLGADSAEVSAQRRGSGPADIASSADAASDFATYADRVGARALPDLLEAAASHITFVEDLSEFSRPQLLARVREVDGGEFGREESLRCFGQLLRSGKITKIKGGRFTAAADIGFRPTARAAG
jgi:hypothetical protein